MFLGDLARICTGKLDVNAENKNGKYPFFTCARSPTRIDNYAFDCECVLVAGNGDLNVKYYKGKFNAYQRTYVIEVVDKKKTDTQFLYFLLNKKLEHLRHLSIGGVIKYIKLNNLTDIEVPDIGIDQQREIAVRFQKAESAVEKRKQADKLTDEFLKSVFIKMFGDPVRNEKGWSVYNGGVYSELITVGVVVKPASYYTDKGVIALRSLNIKPNRIDLENVVYFSKESSNGILSKSILKQGDVVIVRTGLTGTAAVIPPELDGANCIDLIIVRPKASMLNPFYLTFLLNSDIGKRLVSSKEVGGIQKHFNVGAIKNIKFPIPPLDLQQKFANIVQKAENLKQKQRQSAQELDNLFNSLMQRVFNN